MSIDVVIPIYNSENTCKLLVENIAAWAKQSNLDVHVIFVNDASTDNSLENLTSALIINPLSYQIISLAKNYGQHTATAIGFTYCTNKLIATIDDDLQQHPSVISVMLEHQQKNNCDLVFGNYLQKQHSPIRNLGTKILQHLLNLQGKNYAMVTSCRLMKNSVIQVFKNHKRKVIFIDDYLLTGAKKVEACVVPHLKTTETNSRYSMLKLFSFAINILLLHSSLPLKLISRIGLLLSVVFFFTGCFYIYKKIAFDAMLGFTSLIVAIFFSTGLIMFSLGIIGEYIRRLWIVQQQLDEVIIADIKHD